MSLLPTLRLSFERLAPTAAGDAVIVAFSGGVDSTALLWGLAELARRGELPVTPVAAHLDHALDAGSAARAARAARLAADLGVPFVSARREVAAGRGSASLEAAARQARYDFLEDVRGRRGARWIATAHHLDDQAETVLLRLAFGSGLAGLAAIRPRRGALVRPLLSLPKAALQAAVAAAGLAAVDDPTNADLRVPRNRIRHLLLPALAAAEPGLADLPERLARLACRAAGARERLERRCPAPEASGPPSISRAALAGLPPPLAQIELALLHSRAGAPYPPAAAARRELFRQLAAGGAVGCDCGAGWRWEGKGDAILVRRARSEAADGFAYTLETGATARIAELTEST
ncbi:MAG TPA: tRNA lysidine(34) synthetase TilS [Thermoanaerobaculia bacterium]